MFVIKGRLSQQNTHERTNSSDLIDLILTDDLDAFRGEKQITPFEELQIKVDSLSKAVLSYFPDELFSVIALDKSGHRAQIAEDAIIKTGLPVKYKGNDPTTVFLQVPSYFDSRLVLKLRDVLSKLQPYFIRKVGEVRYRNTLRGFMDIKQTIHAVPENDTSNRCENRRGDYDMVTFSARDLVNLLNGKKIPVKNRSNLSYNAVGCTDCSGFYLEEFGYQIVH
jgi:hypothetical protein